MDVKWFMYDLARSLEYRSSAKTSLSYINMVCQSENGQMVCRGDRSYPITMSGDEIGHNTTEAQSNLFGGPADGISVYFRLLYHQPLMLLWSITSENGPFIPA